MGQEMFRQRMGEFTKDKRLLDGFTPTSGLVCRRITPSDPYMPAIQEEDVDFHFTAGESCTEEGVGGADGVEGKVDTIMCANGFDVTTGLNFLPSAMMVSTSKTWEDTPRVVYWPSDSRLS